MVAQSPVAAPPPVPVGPGEPVTPVGPGTRPPTVAGPVQTSVPLAGTKLGAVTPGGIALVVQGSSPAALHGEVEVVAETGAQLAADNVMFYIDDAFVAMTNVVPFRFNLNADNLEPGEHRIKVVVANSGDRTVGTVEAAVIVAR